MKIIHCLSGSSLKKVLFFAAVSLSGLYLYSNFHKATVSHVTPAIACADLPLFFEENRGQIGCDTVLYQSQGIGHSIFLEKEKVSIVLHSPKSEKSAFLEFAFSGVDPQVSLKSKTSLKSVSHYFLSNDSEKWISNVPHFAQVCYEGIYPGIDALFYGSGAKLEYDLIVAPGSDPSQIALNIHGISTSTLATNGDLHLEFPGGGELLMLKPISYQMEGENKIPVSSAFTLLANNENGLSLGFHLGNYDTSKTLIIDPILCTSSYLGGSILDLCNGVSTDSKGNIYVVGQNYSGNFPTTDVALAPNAIPQMGFITKIDGKTKQIVYSSFLGGSDKTVCQGVSTDSQGNAFVVGYTLATDYPTHGTTLCPNPLNNKNKGITSGFVSMINPQGSGFVFSSYLGGTGYKPPHQKISFGDSANSVSVSPNGNAFVTGLTYSSDFPLVGASLSPNAVPDHGVAFVCGINPLIPSFIYSTYLGGSGVTRDGTLYEGDVGYGIAVDPSENAYVTGQAHSLDFPLHGNTLSPNATPSSGVGFVSAIQSGGTGFIYSSYLGGNGSQGDAGFGIATNSSGTAYVVGVTSSENFPLQGNTLSPNANPNAGAGFVSAISSQGPSFIYSTFLGGNGFDSMGRTYGDLAQGVAVDRNGNAFVTGLTRSTDFPVKGKAVAPQADPTRGSAFISAINPSGTEFIYSSLLGGGDYSKGFGVALNSLGTAFVVGQTYALDFPQKGPSLSYDAQPWPEGVGFVSSIAQVAPPRCVKGYQESNSSRHGGLNNILTWKNPTKLESINCKPTKYRIYRDAALTDLAGSVSAKKTLKFIDKNRQPGVPTNYYIVGTNRSEEFSQVKHVVIP